MDKKYKSIGEFKKDYPTEYYYLHYKGWVEKLCEDMGWKKNTKLGYWNYDHCKQEASKFTSVEDWCRQSNKSYKHSKDKGWFEEFSKNMIKVIPTNEWTKELCLQEALKYNTKTKWCSKHHRSYRAAKINGWYDECTAHMAVLFIPSSYWTYERCKEQALKFGTKKEWKHSCHGSYKISLKNKWIDELSAHMKEFLKPPGYWTLERCMEQALKYKVKEHWKKGHPPSYQGAMVHGHYGECTKHMVALINPPNYWTKERCVENAKKFKTITAWSKANSTPCVNARANGWFDECTAHMIRVNKPNGYWKNKERCIKEAKKYKTVSDWGKYSSASYSQSRKNGWYDECTAHMKTKKLT